ncbi:MAG: DUF998 domain-containing protein [Methanobacterium sp.]|jgi:hypothetical protein
MNKNNASIYFLITIIGIIIYLVLDIIVQLLPPHYSPISQTESDLAIGPFGHIMTLNFFVRGIFSLSFLAGSIITLGAKKSQYRLGLILIGIWGVGALFLAIFPTDLSSSNPSLHGIIHSITALLAFLGGGFGTFVITLKFRNDDEFKGVVQYALPLGMFSAIFSIITLLTVFTVAQPGNIWGLIERVFIASILLWMLIISIYSLKNSTNITC